MEEHDHRNSFVFLYLTLSVVLSFAAGLFWLLALVAVHLGFEVYRYRALPRGLRLSNALFGIRLDVTLVLLALALALYMDLLFAVLGLRAFPRAAALFGRFSSRMPSARRVLRTVLMLSDEAVRIGAYIVTARGIADASTAPDASPATHSHWAGPWTVGTWVILLLGVAALLLVAAAPWLTGHGVQGTVRVLLHELSPTGG
jgi:hypothetical protein